jgi:hypothetical protein
MACHLNARISEWFLTFSGQESNWQFDFGLSFSHNLCFKYPNGSCEPILGIYVPRAFQWYIELLNPISFDPCNCFLKIWKSIETPTPKVGVHLGVWRFIPSHFPTLPGAWNVTPGLHFWPALSQALDLAASPRLGSCHLQVRNMKMVHKMCECFGWK